MLRRKIIIGAIGLALLAGCQGTPRYGGGFHDAEGTYQTERASRDADNPNIASKYAVDPIAFGAVIDKYIGRPATGSGPDGKAMDCSEFVDQMYSEYAGIHLPRTTENLFTAGREVAPGDLYFGDLVFFDTGGKGVSHVGIYVGFDEFVHVSSTDGIIISNLTDKYYSKRFLSARRVME
ncbi:MAG: NlpC/P60 family protein [candidate division Zixibacteria bacterium]|nr:NlpC/P60 family protein [candidate division Zixibacteria bacterium]